MKRHLYWGVLAGWLLWPAWANARPACTPQAVVGTVCELGLAELHPTQPGVGLLQVESEQRWLAGMTAEQREAHILKKRIPVVRGPQGQYWLVDSHHLSRALWNNGEREVPVVIEADLSAEPDFWAALRQRHWAWLQDEHGAPIAPEQLPTQLGDLPDIPYRSLAGYAASAGLFDKNGPAYFIEFAWARYLGEQLHWAPVNAATLATRLREAARVACLPQAANLPGYPGRACIGH